MCVDIFSSYNNKSVKDSEGQLSFNVTPQMCVMLNDIYKCREDLYKTLLLLREVLESRGIEIHVALDDDDEMPLDDDMEKLELSSKINIRLLLDITILRRSDTILN